MERRGYARRPPANRSQTRWPKLMTRRRASWLVAVVVLLGAAAVILTAMPDEYGCNASPIPGTTSFDGRNYTCPEVTAVIGAVLRGDGRPIPGSQARLVRGWRCRDASGVIRCTRGRHRWLVAHHPQRR
ncbi:MAG: hypothetical protein QOG56_1684 [Solirubrobacteraceae bacterium]|nr:hypothetical protein [Solirubrobacteraceae bacterium]